MPAPLPQLEERADRWVAFCPDCEWDSSRLPFPTPDQALHALTLHGALCRKSGRR